jgi:1-acyl-sn-glycerol-3-phosphate acyltransferase
MTGEAATPHLIRGQRRLRPEPVYGAVIAAALAVRRFKGWQVLVEGSEHIPDTGPAVIASNHIGLLDFVFLGMAARERRRLVRFMAMEEAFDHRLGGPLLRGMHHIPVDRRGNGIAALDTAIRALQAGQVVGVHPEAKISRTLRPGPAKTGAARMAMRTGAPLVPAALWGTQRLLPRGPGRRPRYPRRVAISVRIGRAIDAPADAHPEVVTKHLMRAIEALLERAMTSYPQQRRGPVDDWWWPELQTETSVSGRVIRGETDVSHEIPHERRTSRVRC